MVTVFVLRAHRPVMSAFGLQFLGLGLGFVLALAFVLGLGPVGVGPGPTVVGGEAVEVFLQAFRLEEIPLVGGLVLVQDRLVCRDDRATALVGFQASRHGRHHRQDSDGDRHPRDERVLLVRRVFGVLGVLVGVQRDVRHGESSPTDDDRV